MRMTIASGTALFLMAAAGPTAAQSELGQLYAPSTGSAVRIYGILDLPVESLHKSSGVQVNRMLAVGALPSRLGFAGSEDLGGGLQAGFRLETGLNLDSGNIQGTPRFFARESSVFLMSRELGELRIGRQYSLMQIAIGKFDVDHMSMYSPMLAAQQSNIEQTSQDNVIGYRSPKFGGFSIMLNHSFGENGAVVAGPPQVVGAGSAKGSSSALLQYESAQLQVGLGYLRAGQNLSAGGEATQQMTSIGALYRIGDFELGGIYWRHRNELSNGRTPTTSVWGAGAKWSATQAFKLVVEVGRAQDNGMTYATGAVKARGRNTFVTFGGDYTLSPRTALYGRFGRISDENGGFNGRPALAAVTARDVSPLTANQSVRGLSIGIRHVF